MKTAFKSGSNRCDAVAIAQPCARTAWIIASLYAAVAIIALAFVTSVRADSIWPTSGRGTPSLFADHKAGAAGDILTIVIAESVAAQNSEKSYSGA